MATGKLVFDIRELEGATVERVFTMPMENDTMAKEYAVVQCGDKRVMFGFVVPRVIVPKSTLVLYEAEKGDAGAFTLAEAIRRVENKPLNLSAEDEERLVPLSDDQVDEMTGMPLNGKKDDGEGEADGDEDGPAAGQAG